jgi:hypothetical protein
MLIPNRTLGDLLANLGALAFGVAPWAIPIAVVLVIVAVLT